MADILRFRSIWGMDPGQDYERWRAWFPQLKAQGYFGVEVQIADLENLHLIRELCDTVGLEMTVLIHTAWPRYIGPRPVGLTVEDHLKIYREQLELARSLRAYKINAQSGCDAWSLDESVAFYRGTLDIDAEIGFTGKVCHETHRNRCMFNPYVAREILSQVPELRITADFSHWVVVCERLLTVGEEDKELLKSIIPYVHHIHARTGTAQSSQCPDPTNPHFERERLSFEKMWKDIIEFASPSFSPITFVPEYGPYPYHPFESKREFSEVADAEGARLHTIFEEHVRQCSK